MSGVTVDTPSDTSIVLVRDFAAPPLTTTTRYGSREIRDAVLATPMRRGVAEGYDRLDAVLADLPSTVPARQTEEAHHAGRVHQAGKSAEEQME